MTRAEMDMLKEGDRVKVKSYNCGTWNYEWIETTVCRVYILADGGKFAHGGRCSVWAKVNGALQCLDNDLTELA